MRVRDTGLLRRMFEKHISSEQAHQRLVRDLQFYFARLIIIRTKYSELTYRLHVYTICLHSRADSMKDNDKAMTTWHLQNLLVPSPVCLHLCIYSYIGVFYAYVILGKLTASGCASLSCVCVGIEQRGRALF